MYDCYIVGVLENGEILNSAYNNIQMKPRIIFIDVSETNFLVRTFSAIKSGRLVKTYKHQFLLRYLQEQGYEVLSLVAKKSNNRFLKNIFNMKFICQLKMDYVTKRNGLKHIPVIIDSSDIREDDIVCAYMAYSNQFQILQKLNCYKLLFGNHFISINDKIDLKACGINGFVNEIDLSNNRFLKDNLGFNNVDSILVPYIYGNRFIVQKPFNERLNKAMAVGTDSDVKIVPSQYKVYKEYFKTTLVQPMRFEILNHTEEIKDTIDSYISHICEDGGKQTNYTKFDMVETFNKYKIAICPEELVGMPGIGFVECMASGCAYIGLEHDMYRCLGLISGKHYIAYDGTLWGLVNKVKEYQTKPVELARIAKCGTEYVRSHFNEAIVAEKFEKQLINSYNKYLVK